MSWNKCDISFYFFGIAFFTSYPNFVTPQTFIRDCNAISTLPGGITGTVYCTAVCGPGAIPSCNSFGICQCDYPCGATPPNPLFTSALCPPPTGVPPDVPEALPGCMDSCPQVCGGGSGLICSSPGPVDVNTFLAICSCSCPPVPCNVTTTTASSVVLLPNLLTPLVVKLKVKKKKGALLALGALLIPLLLKLIGITLLKLLAAFCWLIFMGMEEEGGIIPMEGWSRSW